jgi:hypothetical protein
LFADAVAGGQQRDKIEIMMMMMMIIIIVAPLSAGPVGLKQTIRVAVLVGGGRPSYGLSIIAELYDDLCARVFYMPATAVRRRRWRSASNNDLERDRACGHWQASSALALG